MAGHIRTIYKMTEPKKPLSPACKGVTFISDSQAGERGWGEGERMARETRKTETARALRKADVPTEALLWKILRNRAQGGFKFRRQHPIGPYVVDFACVECKVVIESDGKSHLTRQKEDAKRTEFLEAEGWQVVRFWNTTIYDDLECVKETIFRACETRQAAG